MKQAPAGTTRTPPLLPTGSASLPLASKQKTINEANYDPPSETLIVFQKAEIVFESEKAFPWISYLIKRANHYFGISKTSGNLVCSSGKLIRDHPENWDRRPKRVI